MSGITPLAGDAVALNLDRCRLLLLIGENELPTVKGTTAERNMISRILFKHNYLFHERYVQI